MQLKRRNRQLGFRLAAASCALLGAAAARAQDSEPVTPPGDKGGDWSFDSALAYYHENGRIQAIEPIVAVRDEFGHGGALDLKLTFDSLSGASPNGALTSNKPQTFASPSGKSLNAAPQTYTTASGNVEVVNAPIYTVAPGHLPVDPNYHDQRLAVALDWEHPLTRLTQMTLGGKFSFEHDFLSASVNAGIARDFNDRNTTLALSLNGEFDTIKPIGGTPVPGSDYALFEKTTASEHKNGAGVMLGLTQIMTQHWITELNLSADRFSGYLNDPYKIVSVIDTVGDTTGYLYESRPGERARRSAYLDNRIGWSRVSLALSMRYMRDDWNIRSYTAEARLRFWNPDKDRYFEPTVRWYRQSAASFYTPWLWSTGGPITVASADQRLSAFTGLTYGLKYAAKLDDSQELSIRFEYYEQTQFDRMAAPAALQGLDLYPGLKAILVQVGWKF